MQAHAITLGGQSAVVMPFAKPLSKDEVLKDPAKKKAVRKAATAMAENGLQHGDLNWRHVAYFSPKK